MNALQKLTSLRKLMREKRIHAYIVPSEDAHSSEYTHDSDQRRAFISGFTGSAGTALITEKHAFLWTDGRYWNQASKQLDPLHWKLMKQGNHPAMSTWLAVNPTEYAKAHPEPCDPVKEVLQDGSNIGVDPSLMSTASFKQLRDTLTNSQFTRFQLVSLVPNLVDAVWQEDGSKPSPAKGPIFHLDVKFSGESHNSKIDRIRKEMKADQCHFLVLSALDEIAWLLNLRGADIEYNPVFFSYLLLAQDKVFLYVDKSKFTDDAKELLASDPQVVVEEYTRFLDQEDLSRKIKSVGDNEIRVWMDVTTCNWAAHELVSRVDEKRVRIVEKESPVKMAKAIKNETELQGMRDCHLRDAVALVKLFDWLEKEIGSGNSDIDEVDVAERIEHLRSQQQHYRSLSFATISSSGPNGAIIHYKPERGTCRKVDKDAVFLLDSGAQYLDGTTDVTRTMHFSTPSDHERECFTRVLKGHISLDRLVFPEGVSGFKMDIVARTSLWEIGLDFVHGVGHGVGHFLNVHEGPHSIGTRRKEADDHPFRNGMTITNEPGYYEDGAFGIRIENVLLVKNADTKFRFNNKQYLDFEHITMVPLQKKMIQVDMLTDVELKWVNDYHAEVLEKLAPLLQDDKPSLAWLVENTKPISRE